MIQHTHEHQAQKPTVARPADTTSRSTSPPGQHEQPALTQAEVDAKVAGELVIPSRLAVVLMDTGVAPEGVKAYADQFLADAGNPQDPIEKILVEQILIAHHRLGRLQAQAVDAKTPEMIRAVNAACTRLLGEIRRTALAIKMYRLPPAGRSFSVIHQQNVAHRQDVSYSDQTSDQAKVSKMACRNEVGESQHQEDIGGRFGKQVEESAMRRSRQEEATVG